MRRCSPRPVRCSKSAGASLDYVAFKANTGHGPGQNLLARRLADRSRPARDDDVLALVNPDTYLSPDCLAKLVEALEDDTGIAEARQIPLEHPKAFDPVTGDTPWASGCLIAMRMSVFNSLGGFEPCLLPPRRRRRPLLAGPAPGLRVRLSQRRRSFTTST